jgi:hypothetical protein
MIRLSVAYAALGTSLVAVAASQILIKSRFEHLGIGARFDEGLVGVVVLLVSDPRLWGALFLAVTGATLWYVALVRLPIHVMLPLAAAIAPISSIGAYFYLGEALTAPKMAAIGMIAAGAAWLGALQG